MTNRVYELRIKSEPHRVELECHEPPSIEFFELSDAGNVSYDLAALTKVYAHLNKRCEKVVACGQAGRAVPRLYITTLVGLRQLTEEELDGNTILVQNFIEVLTNKGVTRDPDGLALLYESLKLRFEGMPVGDERPAERED